MSAAALSAEMRQSYFARLHPALCFGYFVAAICLSVLVQHPAYIASGLMCALLLGISLNGRKALKQLVTLLPLWALLSLINPLLNTRGSHVLLMIFSRPYTLEALCYGMALSGMFAEMILWFSAYNAVMTEDKFSYLFATLAPSTAMLLTTVLRMIPNLLRQAKQIAGARRCIGMGGGEDIKSRLQSGMANLSVLTSWALEGSVVTADSMNSRGWGAGRRSCYHSYRFGGSDMAISAMMLTLLALVMLSLAGGGGAAEYTPVMIIATITGKNMWGLAAYMLLLLLPTVLNLKEDIQWHISRSGI